MIESSEVALSLADPTNPSGRAIVLLHPATWAFMRQAIEIERNAIVAHDVYHLHTPPHERRASSFSTSDDD